MQRLSLKRIISLRKYLIGLLLVSAVSFGVSFTDPVKVGSSGPANSKSMLEVSSTSKGVLLPRMTTAQQNAIVTPPEGLLLYDNVLHQLAFFNGLTWQSAGQGAGALPILSGGTGQTTKAAAFDALSPLSVAGDMLSYGGGTNGVIGTSVGDIGKFWASGGGIVPNSWLTDANAFTNLNATQLLTGTVPAARLPNPSSSTLGGVQSAAAVTSNWIRSISTSGVPALSQPAFSDLSGTLNFATQVTGALPIANGGTNNGSLGVTAGGALYTDGTKLMNAGAGTTGQVFTSNGASAPTWNTIAGATVYNSYAANQYGVVLSGASTVMSVLAPSSNANLPLVSGGASANPAWQVLGVAGGGTGISSVAQNFTLIGPTSGSGAPTWRAIVAGDLPLPTIANGGTGQTTKAAAFDALAPCTSGGGGLIQYGSGTNTCLTTSIGDLGKPLVSSGALSSNAYATLTVLGGGTGLTTLTAHSLLIGNGTSNVSFVAPGSAGNVLTSDGTDWTSAVNSAAPSSSSEISNCSLAASVASSALTVALKDGAGSDASGASICKIGFRNATAATGTYTQVSTSAALSVVLSNGSAIGCTASSSCTLYVYGVYTGSALVLGLTNGPMLDEGSVFTSTILAGSGADDLANLLYTTATQTSKPIRLLGRVTITPAAAFAWTNAATEISNVPLRNTTKRPTIQKFLTGTAQTYTTPAGVTYIRVRMVGGGGGGGASGTNAGTAGTNGTSTTFGTSLLTATGGTVGAWNGGGGGGAGGTPATVNSPAVLIFSKDGDTGGSSFPNTTSNYQTGGVGGATPFGGGGRAGAAAAVGQPPAGNTGSGGGGGSTGTVAGASGPGGGAGAYLEAVITAPSATYTYTVGPGGNAQAAGTSGFAGGAGAVGQIIVEEYYQ